MIFNGFIIADSYILTRRQHNTKKLEREALKFCRLALHDLRQNPTSSIKHRIEGIPPFNFTLGHIFADKEYANASSRFFCCSLPGCTPFQFNVVLAGDPILQADEQAVELLLKLSRVATKSEGSLANPLREIVSARPILATTLVPSLEGHTVDQLRRTVHFAADFSTVFAAVLLENLQSIGSLT